MKFFFYTPGKLPHPRCIPDNMEKQKSKTQVSRGLESDFLRRFLVSRSKRQTQVSCSGQAKSKVELDGQGHLCPGTQREREGTVSGCTAGWQGTWCHIRCLEIDNVSYEDASGCKVLQALPDDDTAIVTWIGSSQCEIQIA